MPGSSEWQLFKQNEDECYICDRKIYTIFFWSPAIGKIEESDIGLS
jgi:PP-loop superfamily ATP-utilizing enzyme